jgi:hypothetical protein
LYIKTGFHADNSPGPVLREVGYFAGCAIKSTVVPGTTYFLPADVLTVGHMLAGNRFVAITRTAGLTQNFEFVLDFNGVFQP